MILVNGTATDCVPGADRGLAYGDGVFRTLAVRGGRPQAWRDHFRKLQHDAARLRIACPDEALLRKEIASIAEREPECAVKIIVTRGPGERGYRFPPGGAPTRIVSSTALPRYSHDRSETGIRVRLCTLRLGFQPALAGIKHLNRLENVLARAEWDDPEVAEGLLLDGEGNAIGGTMTNLFIGERGDLATPDLSRCGVAGVTRERILARAKETGIRCTIEHISIERVLNADEVFLVNSLAGVWPVRELNGKTWTRGALATKLKQWIDEEIE